MKIFPLKPVSTFDSAKVLLKIISGEHMQQPKNTHIPPKEDKYVREAIDKTSKLTVNKDGGLEYSVDT